MSSQPLNVNKDRDPLSHAPTESYTMKRNEYRTMQDLKLVKHFANWLTKISEGKDITEEDFELDLLDGVALCTVMSKINGSGLVKFHSKPKDAFQAKENLQFFQKATKNLAFPITFGSEDLEKQNITRVVSTLVFLAHVAHSQGVWIQEMDQEIVDKVQEMDHELNHGEGGDKFKAEEVEESTLSWWQQLLIKFGLGDWIGSLNQESIKAYLATVKQNLENKLPESVKAKIQGGGGEAPPAAAAVEQ